jgi:hypothetical protein
MVDDIKLIETVTLCGCCRPVPLDHLVRLLIGSAIDAATDRRPKFTDEEREQLRRQSSIHSGAVAELVKILTDHPLGHIREHRLATLFEALGSTTFIASHVIENKAVERLRTAAATEVKLADGHRRDEILVEVARAILQKHPTWTRRRVSGEDRAFNERLKAQGLGELEQPSIYKYLGNLRLRLSA